MKHKRLNIMNVKIDNISFDRAIMEVEALGCNHESSYVCFVNSHMLVETFKNETFTQHVNSASLVLADGMPLAFACNILHNKKQERIAGMDFMPRLLSSLNQIKELEPRVFFYGSTEEVLGALKKIVRNKYQNIIIAGAISPPFRLLTEKELGDFIITINDANPHFIFVGLGCPKQEKWMAENYKKINAVLLGVGGAFITTAGLQRRAPFWMQKMSLEWLYRLTQEPRRLFKRYLITNSLFIYLLAKAFLKKLFYGRV